MIFHCADRLISLLIEEMKQSNIKSMMVTIMNMERVQLISKEAVEIYCNGYMMEKELEHQPDEEAKTYHIPKLTDEELELVENYDSTYFYSFSSYL